MLNTVIPQKCFYTVAMFPNKAFPFIELLFHIKLMLKISLKTSEAPKDANNQQDSKEVE